MFPQICLFWIPHMNGIIQCDLLCLASFTQHKLFKVQPLFFLNLYIYLYIQRETHNLFYFWLCWVWFFSSCGEWWLFSSSSAWGYSLCSSFSCCGAQAQYLWRNGLSCSTACGVFLDQRSNLSLLHWHADSLPQSHQGSPSHVTA